MGRILEWVKGRPLPARVPTQDWGSFFDYWVRSVEAAELDPASPVRWGCWDLVYLCWWPNRCVFGRLSDGRYFWVPTVSIHLPGTSAIVALDLELLLGTVPGEYRVEVRAEFARAERVQTAQEREGKG